MLDVTYTAEEDLTNSQYRAVVHGATDSYCALPAGEGAAGVLGILQNRPTEGRPAHVRKHGFTFAYAGGRIARGSPLEVANAAGDLRTAQAAVGSVVGTAEQDALQGQRFKVFLTLWEVYGSNITFSSSSSSSSGSSSSSSSSSSSTSSSSSSTCSSSSSSSSSISTTSSTIEWTYATKNTATWKQEDKKT